MSCPVCDHARDTGWWGQGGTHCGLDQRGAEYDCHRSWTSTSQSHCSECHRHFGSDSAGDAHSVNGVCGDPKGFDRWETPNAPTWGGRDPAESKARMAHARMWGGRGLAQTPGNAAP